MLGTTIQNKEKRYLWIQIAGALFLVSLIALIWKGPQPSQFCSAAGLLFCVTAFVLSLRNPGESPGKALIVIVFLCHGALMATSVVLSNLFLKPLSAQVLKIPQIAQVYDDPNGLFSLKGPVGWAYEMKTAQFESGVIIRPATQGQYMGASETQVWVKKLEKAPESGIDFIEKMAQSMSFAPREPESKKMFEFRTEPIQLLSGEQGVLSIMDMKRLWIPLRQVTLYGVKNGQYFCSVSATGLRSHSTLVNILLLGLFETIQITEAD